MQPKQGKEQIPEKKLWKNTVYKLEDSPEEIYSVWVWNLWSVNCLGCSSNHVPAKSNENAWAMDLNIAKFKSIAKFNWNS